MNLRSKIHLEAQKAVAEKELAAQLALWEQRGLDAAAVQRTASVRQAKATLRKAGHRLASIAAQEERIAERARVKAEKALAAKSAPEPAPEEAPKEKPPKKAKKPKKEE
jgi:hypothetical protein